MKTLGSGPWCGTENGYCYHQCRCNLCTDVRRRNQAARRALKDTYLVRELLNVGDKVKHPKFGIGIVEQPINNKNGYCVVRFPRTYKIGRSKTVKELHYKRLEKVDATHPSN